MTRVILYIMVIKLIEILLSFERFEFLDLLYRLGNSGRSLGKVDAANFRVGVKEKANKFQ